MIENRKIQLNKRTKIGVIIMNLFIPSDTLNHDLVVVKLKTYGYDSDAALLMKSYHTTIYQHCKITARVPQGFIPG